MKFRPSIVAIIFFAGALSMTSCIKKYTCRCEIKYQGYPGLPDSSVNEYEIHDSKAGAKSKCEKNSGTYDNQGIKAIETCELF